MSAEITSISHLLKENIQQIGLVKVYVFGSASRPGAVPSDIDILVIYDNPEQAKMIRAMLDGFSYLPIHLLFLTDEEEIETNFIMAQKCIQIL